jgi:hypothetical protein
VGLNGCSPWSAPFSPQAPLKIADRQPRFVLVGNPERTTIGLAWPPYLVYNSPAGSGHWRMFRIGFRYDQNWRGYIFPTVAWKLVSRPLRY